MKEILLEIGCEEIPASWLPSLTRQLGEIFFLNLKEVRIDSEVQPETFSTPRRLGLYLSGVAEKQPDLEELITGPPVAAAFSKEGEPTKAAEGFARKQRVAVSSLITVETEKGDYLACRRFLPGRLTEEVLPEVLASSLRALPFPKKMNWDAWLDDGHGEFLFGRPIRWVLFLYGEKIVPFTIHRGEQAKSSSVGLVETDSVTFGHRFFSKEKESCGLPIRVSSFSDYKKSLNLNYVTIDRELRRVRIHEKLERAAKNVNGLVELEGERNKLLDEVPDLIEYPSVTAGSFPSEFLSLPEEVLTTTMIHHQHNFPVVNNKGSLIPHFLAVTNTPNDDVAEIGKNAERVLVARLRDARFFWDADKKVSLEDHRNRLETVLFHKKLGNYLSKSDRVSELARRIAKDIFAADECEGMAAKAGLLCKADLATEMVGEFPELQGLMGGIYAREQGEPEEVWKAIYYHYLPIGVEPSSPPSRSSLGKSAVSWASVALADKVDTLVGLFCAGERPTGSRDPFGMRRQAQGIVRILADLPELTGLSVRLSLGKLLEMGTEIHGQVDEDVSLRQTEFIRERTRFLLEERGFDLRNVRAVTHQSSLDDLCPLDARFKLEVLPELIVSEDFKKLATLFKRVKNITKDVPLKARASTDYEASSEDLSRLLTDPAEQVLLDELNRRCPVIKKSVQTGTGFKEAFQEASNFGPAVDRFFQEVFVMSEDESLRFARLSLLKRLEQSILELADVSEIVHEESALN
tara:strand:+ start:293 stop:2536 length:2244 start_codon:yes stop_codon:yes gene_type:complete